MVSQKGIIIALKCHSSKAIQVINKGFNFLFTLPSRFCNTFSYKCLGFILFHLGSLWCCRGMRSLTHFDEQNLVERNKSHHLLSVWSETKQFTRWVWASEKIRLEWSACVKVCPPAVHGVHTSYICSKRSQEDNASPVLLPQDIRWYQIMNPSISLLNSAQSTSKVF